MLELESLLSGYDDLPEPPRWVFGVIRAVLRARALAYEAHGAALCVRGFHDDAKPATEAGDAP
ncbi:MAG TPA: hypothetical protein VMS38_12345 [Pseudorhodoferax sp.]|nr:hypothetical protein [Pseudorhodoferax sp.]